MANAGECQPYNRYAVETITALTKWANSVVQDEGIQNSRHLGFKD